MKKYLGPLLGIILPSIVALLFAILWIYYNKEPNYGGMLILAITFIALVCYTYFNYQTLKEPYKPFGKLDLMQVIPESDDLRVIVRNLCRVPLKAKLNLNPTIYGKPVELPPDLDIYCGKREWELAPVSGIDGHIQATTILEAAGRTFREMVENYNDDVANQQLRIEAEILFDDYKGNTFNPKVKLKFVYNFKRRAWIMEV